MKFVKPLLASALVLAVPAAPSLADNHAETATAPKPNHTPAGSQIAIPAPPPGKGQIVFFRPSGMGFAMGCTVNKGTQDNKIKVTSLGNGKYAIVVADPGKQDYWVKNEKKDGLTLLVEEGETQFVRCQMKMGLMSGRPDISPSDAATFAEKSDGLKPVNDDDLGEGALRAEDIAAAL